LNAARPPIDFLDNAAKIRRESHMAAVSAIGLHRTWFMPHERLTFATSRWRRTITHSKFAPLAARVHRVVYVGSLGDALVRHANLQVSTKEMLAVGNRQIARQMSPNARSGKYIIAKTKGKQNSVLTTISG
jgi:hypothetical protein